MKVHVILLLSFIGIVLYQCQSDKSKSTNPNSEAIVFPDDWLGYWEGDLEIFDKNGLKQKIPMAIDNTVTDTIGTYVWAIIYGADSLAQRRDYRLIEVDAIKGHYRVDEKNGILLDAYLIDNELISVFEVQGNTIISTYTVEGEQLIFSIKMYNNQLFEESGDTLILGEAIPLVRSYKTAISQKARLDKKCLVE